MRRRDKLPELTRMEMEKQAQRAADVFKRSSSCVEGRNVQLSLRHHGLRELTASKLRALRTIHNYVIRRPEESKRPVDVRRMRYGGPFSSPVVDVVLRRIICARAGERCEYEFLRIQLR